VKVRLYLDEDSMSRGLVQALTARGIDVESALDAGMIGIEDERHLEYAARNGRALYSANSRDFQRLHYELLGDGRSHSGIILIPQQNYSVGEQLRRLLRLTAAKSAEDMEGRLEFLSNWG